MRFPFFFCEPPPAHFRVAPFKICYLRCGCRFSVIVCCTNVWVGGSGADDDRRRMKMIRTQQIYSASYRWALN